MKLLHRLFVWGLLVACGQSCGMHPSHAQAPSSTGQREELGSEDAAGKVELDGVDGRELLLRNFQPKSQLRVRATDLGRAKFPVVDVHTHFFFRQRHSEEALDDFVGLMDRHQIAICISLDAKLGVDLDDHLQFLHNRYRDRFVVFAHLDWVGDGDPDDPATWASNRPKWAERTAEQLAKAKEKGISGLKIFKRLGVEYRDRNGQLIPVDSPMLDPIWEACGQLGLPVLIHTADPEAFFEPIDATNERWEELSRHPDWHFYGKDFPSRQELVSARNRMIARHPQTKFIAAHMGSSSEDLEQLGEWLDQYPNLYIDPASRISELGRQPYTARDFLIRYADRILFGTDGPWPEQRIKYYWRFFETRDEYFPYSEKEFPPQGFWRIYGVYLPDDVLRKLYFENAMEIVPGVRERIEKQFPALR